MGAGAVFMQETEEKAADTETKAAKDAPAVVEYAESLPMLVKRPQLKGYVGDVGFDPLGFSEILPMDWLREAELKHCRVYMLAFVGMIFTDFYTLPGYEFSTLEAHDAGVANGSRASCSCGWACSSSSPSLASTRCSAARAASPATTALTRLASSRTPPRRRRCR